MKRNEKKALAQIAVLARKGRSDTSDKDSYRSFEKIIAIADPDGVRAVRKTGRKNTAGKRS